MAQGTRKWVRVVAAGLGALACSTLVGCLNGDKDKKDKAPTAKQPTPGLYGTPTIPPGSTAKGGAPGQFGSSGIQQTGAAVGQPRYGSSGINNLNTNVPQPNYGGPGFNPGGPTGTIGAPAVPGTQPNFVPSVQPGAAGSFVPPAGPAAPPPGWGGNNTAAPSAPAGGLASAVPLGHDIILPPPPQGGSTAVVTPPTSSFAPIAPPTPGVPPTVTAFGNTASGK